MQPTRNPGPLSGLLVVDMTHVLAGPYCTMLLADLGARVIKVEPPEGDGARQIGPFLKDQSVYFMSVNRNKESIALNLTAEADRAILHELLARADILVENFRPGTAEKLGLGWEALHASFPRLIFASISGFGQTGPYRRRPAFDMVVQAMGGIMSLTGQPDGPPTRVGISIGDLASGMFAAIGIQAAVIERNRTASGTRIDVSMLDCQVALLENALARYQATGELPSPIGARHPTAAPFDVFRAGDGWIAITASPDPMFRALCEALGDPGLASDERYADRQVRVDHQAELKGRIEARLQAKPVSEWLEILERKGVPCGPLNNVKDLLEDPQLAAREMLVELRDATGPVLKVAGNPIKIGSRPVDPIAFPPALDEHRSRILDELSLSRAARNS
jgi:CoA:oxalate CoA-transferase